MGLTERAFVCVLCWVLFVELSASCWLAAALADDRASGDGFSAFATSQCWQERAVQAATGSTSSPEDTQGRGRGHRGSARAVGQHAVKQACSSSAPSLTNSQCWQERAVQTATGSTSSPEDTQGRGRGHRGSTRAVDLAPSYRPLGGRSKAKRSLLRSLPVDFLAT